MHILLLLASISFARDFRAGVAKIDITPSQSIWMSGYAARTKPSEGALQKIYAKALAFDDGKTKVVIVTTDLIGLPRAVSDVVAARVGKQYELERSQVLMNSSHTHSGPVVKPNLMTMYFMDGAQRKAIDEYRDKLVEDLVGVIGAAIGGLAPAKLSIAHGSAGFAINRRASAANPNRPAPIDHDVPVIAVSTPQGEPRAFLFGYACHNTTMGGDFYQINGDYAGYAQEELEKLYPKATALFMLLCGGDQNPSPRGKLSDAQKHGVTLANEVSRVWKGQMKPIVPNLKASFVVTELAFAPHSREQFELEAKSDNRYRASRAREMLRAYDERRPIRSTPYPVQAIKLTKGVALLALGGEVVVDYAIRAKKEFAGTDLIVAGYSNDVMCYIPSLRILREGGYEGGDAMMYYGQPGPFTDEVEETVFRAIHRVLK